MHRGQPARARVRRARSDLPGCVKSSSVAHLPLFRIGPGNLRARDIQTAAYVVLHRCRMQSLCRRDLSFRRGSPGCSWGWRNTISPVATVRPWANPFSLIAGASHEAPKKGKDSSYRIGNNSPVVRHVHGHLESIRRRHGSTNGLRLMLRITESSPADSVSTHASVGVEAAATTDDVLDNDHRTVEALHTSVARG